MTILYFSLFVPWFVFLGMTLLSLTPVKAPVLYLLLLVYPIAFGYFKFSSSTNNLVKYLPLLVFIALFFVFGARITA